MGYSFAVPSNIARKVVEDLMEYGTIQKGIMGIRPINTKSPYAIEQGINEIEGVYISVVDEDTGAADAGLLEGDVIKKVDNIKVRKFPDLTGYLSTKRPKDEVQVTIERDGELLMLPVVLKERQTITLPQLEFVVKNLNATDRKKFKTKKGVKIVGVPEMYRGYGLGGKVLLSLDDQEINNVEDAKILFDKITRYGKTSITMINEDGEKERLIFQ